MKSTEKLLVVFAMILAFIYGWRVYDDIFLGVSTSLTIAVFEFIHVLSSKNPFNRVLREKKYWIGTVFTGGCDFSISFDKSATSDDLRDALFDGLYEVNKSFWEYQKPSITFSNFIKTNKISDLMKPFHFFALSFDEVSPDSFQIDDFLLLPCERLYLPCKLSSVNFLGYEIPHIREIILRSHNFIHLVPHADYSSDPFKASSPLNIVVRDELLDRYRTDPTWSSLKFIDQNGNISSVTFNGLPPYIKDPHVRY